MNSDQTPIHPLRFLKELINTIPDNALIVSDPGVGAIYPSAFYQLEEAGRNIVFNYALGALGYALPASIGACFSAPDSPVIALVGDGSFGFSSGELETLKRLGRNINIITFNNASFGWIRAAYRFNFETTRYFQTGFSETDYSKIAESYGINAYKLTGPADIYDILRKAFEVDGPSFIDLKVKSEDELVPPVPSWSEKATKENLDNVY